MGKVVVTAKKVLIPTYEIEPYDKNPMFLEKRVYQGSSGRVYPHPVSEGIKDEKKDKEYNAIYLENDYILVMILPELGGRIQRLYDKTNGYDAVYYNEVVKPALVGLAGPWISGGIEFNWPQHHRPSTYDPVDERIVTNEDGSVTVWVGETEKMFHTKGEAGFTVYPDKAYLEIKGRVYNPTDRPQTFLWWANPAVSVNDHTQSVFPPDVTAVMDHGKRDVSKFPIADGVYYKVNYAPGTDISRYRNIPVPTSYMAYHSDYDFIGNYDDAKEAGLLHVANHHVSPGKKQWTWGNGDFGKAWDRNLTDENGPYIELMTGMFTDNQPDFTYLKPLEEKEFVQYFMPYKQVGAIKTANKDLAFNVLPSEDGMDVFIYSSSDCEAFTVEVWEKETCIFTKDVSLDATKSIRLNVKNADAESAKVVLKKAGKEILSYQKKENTEPIPKPADAMPRPEDVATNEELFLNGMHLEQYRHATYDPKDYYLEGLRRDPSDLRINNAYGKLLYKKGYFEESLEYFKAAVKKATFRNPNPYDCEPYYNLGLAYLKCGQTDKAYDAFFKATWDGNLKDKAFYRLCLMECAKGNYEEAVSFAEESLNCGSRNLKARTIKTALLRILGKTKEAYAYAKETNAIDPLDMGAVYELSLLEGNSEEFACLMRNDAGNYIELALTYIEAGLLKDAKSVLQGFMGEDPMVGYYRFLLSKDEEDLQTAEKASSLYCFPNRPEDIEALTKAYKAGGNMAGYYLGLLYYDMGNWEASLKLWEDVKDKISLPTVYRNLSLIYYNKLHKEEQAYAAIEKAFLLDTDDARVLFEFDQLKKVMEQPASERLSFLEEHEALLETRDNLYTEYITLLNDNGRYEEALSKMLAHKFHPWEGGEGKITSQYRRALMEIAAMENEDEKASNLLKRALSYPENLGEGKLIGALDNDIYYFLGTRAKGADEKEAFFSLGARGEVNLSSAMYYNDQPTEMIYYMALCEAHLGNRAKAKEIFTKMKEYGEAHKDDTISIDYFAVSLPDFLIYEGDLNRKNELHCLKLIEMANQGMEKLATIV